MDRVAFAREAKPGPPRSGWLRRIPACARIAVNLYNLISNACDSDHLIPTILRNDFVIAKFAKLNFRNTIRAVQ